MWGYGEAQRCLFHLCGNVNHWRCKAHDDGLLLLVAAVESKQCRRGVIQPAHAKHHRHHTVGHKNNATVPATLVRARPWQPVNANQHGSCIPTPEGQGSTSSAAILPPRPVCIGEQSQNDAGMQATPMSAHEQICCAPFAISCHVRGGHGAVQEDVARDDSSFGTCHETKWVSGSCMARSILGPVTLLQANGRVPSRMRQAR